MNMDDRIKKYEKQVEAGKKQYDKLLKTYKIDSFLSAEDIKILTAARKVLKKLADNGEKLYNKMMATKHNGINFDVPGYPKLAAYRDILAKLSKLSYKLIVNDDATLFELSSDDNSPGYDK